MLARETVPGPLPSAHLKKTKTTNKQTKHHKKKKKTAKTLSILITIQLLMDSLEHFFCSFIDINTVL